MKTKEFMAHYMDKIQPYMNSLSDYSILRVVIKNFMSIDTKFYYNSSIIWINMKLDPRQVLIMKNLYQRVR